MGMIEFSLDKTHQNAIYLSRVYILRPFIYNSSGTDSMEEKHFGGSKGIFRLWAEVLHTSSKIYQPAEKYAYQAILRRVYLAESSHAFSAAKLLVDALHFCVSLVFDILRQYHFSGK